jgi:hypothetical protein
MDVADLANRFKFHPASSEYVAQSHETIRATCGQFANALNGLLPEGREKSLAITKLEEVMMWSNAAVARNN